MKRKSYNTILLIYVRIDIVPVAVSSERGIFLRTCRQAFIVYRGCCCETKNASRPTACYEACFGGKNDAITNGSCLATRHRGNSIVTQPVRPPTIPSPANGVAPNV
jgi:hypothetical protein